MYVCSHDIRVEWFHVSAVTPKTAVNCCERLSQCAGQGKREWMELEINLNLNYKMRDGKILHKGLRFWEEEEEGANGTKQIVEILT